MTDLLDAWFSVEAVAPGVTRLSEPFVHRFVRANIWLIEGPERDLVVDFGCGLVPLAPAIAALRRDAGKPLVGKPLLALATHMHVDHVGGFHEFAERLGPAVEADAFTRMDDADTLAGFLRGTGLEDGAPAGSPDPTTAVMRPAPLTRALGEGDVVDLGGGRRFTALHLPGHSPGSLALFDAATGTLVAGDVVYEGEIVDDLAHSDIALYRASMQRILDLPIITAFCGHGPVLDGTRTKAAAAAYLALRASAA